MKRRDICQCSFEHYYINLSLHKRSVVDLRFSVLRMSGKIIKEVEFICKGRFDLFLFLYGLVKCRSPPRIQFKNELNGGKKNDNTICLVQDLGRDFSIWGVKQVLTCSLGEILMGDVAQQGKNILSISSLCSRPSFRAFRKISLQI